MTTTQTYTSGDFPTPEQLGCDRVLAVGDTHHNIVAFIAACVAAKGVCTHLVSVGDFGWFPGTDYGQEFIAQVEAALEEYGLYLIVIDGNHDDIETLTSAVRDENGFGVLHPRIRYAPRGLHWNWGGVEFLACGGAVSVDRASRFSGINWWPGEALSWVDVNACIDAGHADVVISHDCPEGVSREITLSKMDSASDANRQAVRAIVEAVTPQLVVHGHYHYRSSCQITLESGVVTSVEALGRDGDGAAQLLLLDLNKLAGAN